ncbi:MAG TPA: DUF6800 family protein [Blastocatellia bacterium]|nr:DUF6800 family protein [Blastocatellia bacterium]
MRERNREIKRRRHRYEKRKKLRRKLASAATEGEKRQLEARIRRTMPKFMPDA